MLGLDSLGLVKKDSGTGKIFSLYVTVSVMPINSVEVKLSEDGAEVSGSFQVYNEEGSKETLWYKRGEVNFEVTKKVKISAHNSKIVLGYRIVNKSNEKLTANCEYHIQLRPLLKELIFWC